MPLIPKVKAIFDTSVLHDDLAMTGLNSRTILGQAAREKFDLVIPEVVFLEMANKMREQIERATDKMARGASSLKKFGVGQGITTPDPVPLTSQFTKDLKARIEESGTLVPIPGVDHSELVARTLIGKKPFRTSGVGYRDALIWHTVLEQAQEDDVIFVSANTKDFATEDGKLHPDLVAEVANGPHDVTLLTSIDEFIDQHIPAADQALTQAQQNLDDPTFRTALEEAIASLLGDYGSWPYHSDVTLIPNEPPGVLSEGPQVTQVDGVDILGVDAEEAVEFDPDEEIAVLTLKVKAELLLDMLFDKSDAYWLLESNAEVSFYDIDYNESYAAGQSLIFVVGEVQVLFNQDDDAFEDLELIALGDLFENDKDHPAAAGQGA